MKHTQPEPGPRPADGAQAPQGLELRHLRYFVAVADAGSFTHAAERIFVAQATLSQQIRRLEQIVGTPLLDRRREGLRLTTAGGVLLDASRNVLSLVDHEVSLTRQAAGLGRPRLRMIIPPGLPEDLAVEATAALRVAAAAADVNVTWLETALDTEFSLIHTRRADAGLGWLTTGPDAVPAPLEVMILGEFEPDLWIPPPMPQRIAAPSASRNWPVWTSSTGLAAPTQEPTTRGPQPSRRPVRASNSPTRRSTARCP